MQLEASTCVAAFSSACASCQLVSVRFGSLSFGADVKLVICYHMCDLFSSPFNHGQWCESATEWFQKSHADSVAITYVLTLSRRKRTR
uniref:Putative secreted protein n=1 Tax=Anopheles triannulatus TaxID=58253 RepID=A0A2M4B6X6_9DIPT